MAELLINLRNAPADEIDDLIELLDSHQIDYYQTSGGSFGLSLPGLWVNDADQFQRARSLIDQYQHERQQRIRAQFQQAKDSNQHDTVWARLKRIPNRMITFSIMIFIVIIASIKPFMDMF
ncbi:hypothetical protein SIN8267_02437 [Sinobacterium norvegicum]|uniref:DUF2007 domain-containing protein n=1 Tax=Sinobacterium norvegicum TaxID=1641715 RepID=A0ABM9AGI5_9GAMM|nr:DUF6164 family protein [Sinobacterium norvegicum]CAH0992318.1 hypothetical protein SIN8267_02437 [Sinobacterium norvegicum]